MLYGALFAAMCNVAADEIITMSPRGFVRIAGITSFDSDHAPNTCVSNSRCDLGGFGVLHRSAAARDAGVVDEDVDRTELGDRPRPPSSRTASKSATSAAYACARRPSCDDRRRRSARPRRSSRR